ncbi:LysR family transcriptional regulator [Parendozoicomonas haliclonae]|uniref:HTH-type transcriptional regulator LeuO n=1 Tax=Parendozoicomonas haliclonae TaxID=1960125 RepID=A0A1X7AHK2_9GAMM|nr:LysR family transcriptional regulator [Parendozoicomonas haliclonae]SMA42696.1 HTH-type transcriptional regulator LeuO [Parendozoicomonas haliclonae]
MHVSRLDLNLLRVLEAIAVSGSLTQASKELNLTQPAVSHALGRLREQLGDPLFIRAGRGLQPTPYTRERLPELRRLLSELDKTLGGRESFDPASSQQTFRLAMHEAMESTLLPALMASLQQQAPEVIIQSVKLERRLIEKELQAGQIDLAVDVLLPVGELTHYTLLDHAPMVVVARKNHPRLDGEVSMAGYLREKHVLISSRREGLGYEDQFLASQEMRRTIALRARDYKAGCLVVAASDLLLTLPLNYAQQLSSDLELQVLAPPFPVPEVSSYLYWHSSNGQAPALQWLRHHIQALSVSLL